MDWPRQRLFAQARFHASIGGTMGASVDGGQVQTFRASASGPTHARDVGAFREQFGRAILRLEMTPLGDRPLECDIVIRAVPDLALAAGTLSPMRNHHPEQLGDDGLVLAAVLTGNAELRRRGGTCAVRSGEAVLTANDEAATFIGSTPTRVANIRLRRDRLALSLADPLAALGRPVPAGNVALRLLLGYVDVLADSALVLDDESRRVAVSNIYDLAALGLGGVRDARTHLGGMRAARLHALKTDIVRHMGEAGLNIGDVARRQGISASYARRLFAADGTAFFEYLLEQRLAAAHRRLASRSEAGQSIGSIAFEVGFGDLSYFNRTFRRRYGMTPSDVRAKAAGRS
ncbi:MAG TPA: AraC family transcriptional regulator [Devosia sp.]|nr:AraC family transcriptional regulator [Devosia sp.]